MIILASDHAGYVLKEKIKKILTFMQVKFLDIGTSSLDLTDDYPDYAIKAGKVVLENEENKGIFICGTGIGMSITANKIKGIRATTVNSKKMVELAVKHNHVNVITLSGRFLPNFKIKGILHAFLNSEFEGGRHERRIEKITALE